jgi:hypothetical protein
VPAIIDTLDGTPVVPHSMIIYYKTGYNGVKPADIKSLPQGLRMIAGDSKNSGPYQWGRARPLHLHRAGNGHRTQHAEPADDLPDRQHDLGRGRVPAVLGRRQPRFAGPQEPHVVPGERRLPGIAPGRRPRDHRQRALRGRRTRRRLRGGACRPIPTIRASLPGIRTTPTGFNGWKPQAMDAFVQNCDKPPKDCHAHLLGNGQKMLGVGV